MRDIEDFDEWLCYSANQAEKELCNKVFSFEDHFNDMLFRPGTKPYEMTLIQANNMTMGDSLPDELESFDYGRFYYQIESSEQYDGFFNQDKGLLSITPEALKQDSVVLHEMIHLHESIINSLPLYYHDTLFWALYLSLRDKIDGIDRIITSHSHITNEANIYSVGGLHDILFLLKSFDLDIRQGYRLGTVFGYDRTDIFEALRTE